MKTLIKSIVILAALCGCQSVDPATGKSGFDPALTSSNIDLVIETAEAVAAIAITDKHTYDALIVRAEQIRRINDLPAAQRLLASLSSRTAAVVPAIPPTK